jgi:hypothetical protein
LEDVAKAEKDCYTQKLGLLTTKICSMKNAHDQLKSTLEGFTGLESQQAKLTSESEEMRKNLK